MKFIMRLWILASAALVAASGAQAYQSWTKTDQITSSSGAAVDFPAGFTTVEGAVWSNGSATVTPTTGTNVTFVSAAAVKYVAAGNNVHAFGETSIAATAAASSSVFYIPLPVSRATGFTASTTSGAEGRCGKVDVATGAGVIAASGGASSVICTFTASGTAPQKIGFVFDYVLTGD